MKTYQDLLSVGKDKKERALFCRSAINEFMASKEYKKAKDGEAYYNKHNLTIEKYQKFLYTVSGNKVPDVFSANYKIKTLFFRRLVMQQVQYVLGNGISMTEDANNKERLGKDFDFKLQKASKRAMASGRAFGFWNLDHLEVFGYCDTENDAGFCPLYNEETAQLDAGIRFWFRGVGKKQVLRCTLYEADGYTEYRQLSGDEIEEVTAKKAYKTITKKTLAGGIEDVYDENYSALPIVPLYANDTYESELEGIREAIDCYDFIKNGLMNDADNAGMYWILKNTGGMDDTDLAQFIQRIKTVRGAVVDGDAGVSADATTLDIPYQARQTILEILRKDIYEDFQALDVNTLSASAKTTQEIQASYQAQDNKCADFEYYVLDFVQKIMDLAEIDDTPYVVWNRVVNQAEQTQMVLNSANYLTDEAIVKHLPFITPEEADAIIKDKADADYDRWNDEPIIEDDEE